MTRFPLRIRFLSATAVVGVAFIVAVAGERMKNRVVEDTKVTRAKEDFLHLSQAVHDYQSATGSFPTTEEGLEILTRRPHRSSEKWLRTLEVVPIDPWGNRYRHRRLAAEDSGRFEIYSLGKDGIPSADDLSELYE